MAQDADIKASGGWGVGGEGEDRGGMPTPVDVSGSSIMGGLGRNPGQN